MTSSNRVQLAAVVEATIGTTPNTPRMRKARITGESLSYTPTFVDSDEIRADRMTAAPIQVFKESAGGVNVELHYPVPDSVLSNFIASTMFRDWINTPTRYNDGTADSVITDIGTTANTITFATGSAFVVGHLVRNTGFGVSGNNGLFPVTTGGTTSLVSTGASFTAETAPPAEARVKVVGFQGTTGDITATATGLGSTTMNFTTLGISPGMFIKIGGTGTAFRFGTEALNTWVRVTAVTATALTLDHLPSGWATDTGSGKTIRVFFGDWTYNGTAKIGLTIERGFLGQATPTYIVQRGMVANQMQAQVQSRQKINASFDFIGMTGGESATTLDAVPDEAPSPSSYPVMAANVNVGRVNENGSAVSSPNYVREVAFTINNNIAGIEAVDSDSFQGHREGECMVSGTINTYFGSDAILARFYAGTQSSLNFRVAKNSQALVWQFPSITYNSNGNPNAAGKNQDVMLNLGWKSSVDSLIGCHVAVQRFDYYQD
ncbi:hypothetical protein D9623_33610 (plasmid) [Azospirillum brasilense]|uniref:Phage tail tube protein n=1 Tax=Azospirillum brasilense TaxID=192 RepID=A0A4D8QW92_AZOBR|nr:MULTISPECIES: phage tail tube protein [Azospirillum]YP_001686881.1 hypothetical protein APCd_gp40 [Azospirillum phage Cd]MDW7555379.1 phage tail tube protein [Azospirillum brasilense]MDW7595213.1 phage tail tube protein [Azospirillum brasilense]MDW7630366.1 phage tail tube protein [Azospirillum brasilense]MDX5949734.1 phage tail tube protein [Azospirillum brasilense]OPH16865.1 hypothetical protein FE89_02595 [Azospirillum brasilense]